ncbi:hypothetical protein JCM3774_006424 [Rhodotorula dairenensis]
MESLGQLNTALPPNELAEQALASSFRQAALSITALFKQGKRATTKAYIAGQRQALQEVLEFMQAMLDHSGSQSGAAHAHALPVGSGAASGATSLGQIDGSRLINFICARQEALKAEEEDYDEEEVSGPGAGSSAMPPRRAASAAPAAPSAARPSMPFGTRSEGATRAQSPTPRTVPTGPAYSTAAGGPVASGSSAPPSPTSSLAFSPPFTRSTASLFRPTSNLVPTVPAASHSHSAPPASPSPLGTAHTPTSVSANPPSPLGRPSSRLHRDYHHHHPHRTRNSSRSNGSSTAGTNNGTGAKATQLVPAATGLSAAGGDESTSAGVKRRWAREAVGFGAGQGGDADVIEVHAPREHDPAGRDGMDVEPMADLEGWDGIGERPPKRTMRSVRASATSTGSSSSGGAADPPPSDAS